MQDKRKIYLTKEGPRRIELAARLKAAIEMETGLVQLSPCYKLFVRIVSRRNFDYYPGILVDGIVELSV